MKNFAFALAVSLAVLAAAPLVSAASISVSQAGMEVNTLLKSSYFTITADLTGISDAGIVTLTSTPSGFSSDEGDSKSFSSGTTSVSWTTAKINQELTGQTISAQIQTTGEPSTVTTSSFSVVSPPSLSISVTPSSYTTPAGGAVSTTVYMTLTNVGGSAANSVVAVLSGSGCSGASITGATQTKSSLAGGSGGSGESWSVSWPVAGTISSPCTLTATVTASNAESVSGGTSVTYTGGGSNPPGGGDTTPTTPSGGVNIGGSTPAKVTSATQTVSLAEGTELKDDPEVKAAAEKILGALTPVDVDRMLTLSKSLSSEFRLTRTFSLGTNTTSLFLDIENAGARNIKNLLLTDTLTGAFGTADKVTVSAEGATVEVADSANSKYVIVYPEFLPGQKMRVIYTVSGEVDASIINKTKTEIYAGSIIEKLAEGKACSPGTKRCSGSEIQQCTADGGAWEVINVCDYGCNPSTFTCKPVPSVTTQSADYTPLLLIVAVIAIVAIAVFILKRKKLNL